MILNIFQKKKEGFTIIESLVFLFIFTVTVVTFYSTATLGLNYILETKIRLAAVQLVNEKMEIIRSLEYENIGTVGNAEVPGEIDPDDDVIRSGRSYKVLTEVGYKDDAFDGLAVNGTDARPNDHKYVRIKASWDISNVQKEVVMTAIFAAPGIEPPLSGGILSVNVVDNSGNAVSGASIRIKNPSLSPAVDDTKTTGADGNYLFIGVPASNQGYELIISKSGYYPVRTYPPYTGSPPSFTPVDVYASVIAGALGTKTMIMDRLSDIVIRTVDPFGNAVADAKFDLKGGKKIGEDEASSPPKDVYDFNQTGLDSGSLAEEELQGVGFGTYFFTYSENLPGYDFIKMDPSLGKPEGFDVLPGSATEVKAIFADKNLNSLLVKVVDNADDSYVGAATVRIKNITLGFDETQVADENGYAFFPKNMPALVAAQYELEVTADGFENKIANVDIDKFVIQEIHLTAN